MTIVKGPRSIPRAFVFLGSPLLQDWQGIVPCPRQPLVQRGQHGKPPVITQKPVRLTRGDSVLFDDGSRKQPMEHVSAEPCAQAEKLVIPAALGGRRQLARPARQSRLGERREPPQIVAFRRARARRVRALELPAWVSMARARFPGARRYPRALPADRRRGQSRACPR